MKIATSELVCVERLTEKFGFLFEKELIEEMCHHGQPKKFDKETELMDIGQVVTHMPLILTGSVKVLTEDEEGRELLLYYLELGDTCAVTLNCCSRRAKSTIRAIAEPFTEVLFVPVELMEQWMVKYESWRNFVLESYNMRLNEMLEAIDNLAFNNMEERLSKYLSDKAMIMKSKEINITHLQISRDLNSSRVVISRLMKKLERDEQLIQHRNRIELTGLAPF
ncbi:MAG: Crp/Fnr family transcriptional regulator [Bacteroidia bacterium]|nr:Crp/Fnr family transcriptional regulator [Bacteroidia bacterium]